MNDMCGDNVLISALLLFSRLYHVAAFRGPTQVGQGIVAKIRGNIAWFSEHRKFEPPGREWPRFALASIAFGNEIDTHLIKSFPTLSAASFVFSL